MDQCSKRLLLQLVGSRAQVNPYVTFPVAFLNEEFHKSRLFPYSIRMVRTLQKNWCPAGKVESLALDLGAEWEAGAVLTVRIELCFCCLYNKSFYVFN